MRGYTISVCLRQYLSPCDRPGQRCTSACCAHTPYLCQWLPAIAGRDSCLANCCSHGACQISAQRRLPSDTSSAAFHQFLQSLVTFVLRYVVRSPREWQGNVLARPGCHAVNSERPRRACFARMALRGRCHIRHAPTDKRATARCRICFRCSYEFAIAPRARPSPASTLLHSRHSFKTSAPFQLRQLSGFQTLQPWTCRLLTHPSHPQEPTWM